MTEIQAPSGAVLQAFGAAQPPELLPGGRGRTWRSGEVVLKPLDMPEEALQWLAAVAAPRLRSGQLRVSWPITSRGGTLVVDGWTAFPALAGRHLPGRWTEIIDAGGDFSTALRQLPEPRFIRSRNDSWARADRAAWSEEPIAGLRTVPHLAGLFEAMEPVAEPSMVVHGDLTGNVLFHPTLPPAVVDLSLYWRPAAYSTAIVLVDALAFEGADNSVLDETAGPAVLQCMLRAYVFRIATDYLTGSTGWMGGDDDPYAAGVGRLLEHLGRD